MLGIPSIYQNECRLLFSPTNCITWLYSILFFDTKFVLKNQVFIAFPLLIPNFFNILGLCRSIIQLLVKSRAIVLSLFHLCVAIIFPSFAPSARNTGKYDPQSADSACLQTWVKSDIRAVCSFIYSTLVAFKWLDRKLSFTKCQIAICMWSWISNK